jgi:hypothetical protein
MVAFITIFGFAYAFSHSASVLSPTKSTASMPRSLRRRSARSSTGTISPRIWNDHCGAARFTVYRAIARDKRLIYVTAIGLMGIALLLSGSRGGLVSLLAQIFFLVLLTTQSKSRSQIGLKIALALLLLATSAAARF